MLQQTACHHGHPDSRPAIALAKTPESPQEAQIPKGFLSCDRTPPRAHSAGTKNHSLTDIK